MRICFIGDSIVNGQGDDEYLGWPGRLCRDRRAHGFDLTCYNLGVRGDTSALVLARWEREVAPRVKPGIETRLVFSFGINDCVIGEDGRRRVAPEETAMNTRQLLELATPRFPSLFVGPPPARDRAFTAQVSEVSAVIGEECAAFGVPFCNLAAILGPAAADGTYVTGSDGFHPARAGYTRIAETIAAWEGWRSWF